MRENELVPEGESNIMDERYHGVDLGVDVDADIDALHEGELNIIEEPAVSDDDNQEMVLEKNDKLNLMDAQLEKERQKYEKEKK